MKTKKKIFSIKKTKTQTLKNYHFISLIRSFIDLFIANLSTRRKFAIFGKYSNLPKCSFSEMCGPRQTRRHSPTCFARTRQTRQHLPTCFARTRQTCWHLPNHFARTCQTRERQVWQVLHKFSEFGEFGKLCIKQPVLLAPTFIKRLGQYSPDSPTFANLFC